MCHKTASVASTARAVSCCGTKAASIRTATLNVASTYECDRTIAFAIVDNQLVNPCLEPLFWRVEHVPAGCTFEVATKISGEFGIRVGPVGSCGVTYTSHRVNRLGTTTVIGDAKYSGLSMSSPVQSSSGNRYDVKVLNNSSETVEVTVGLIGCNGSFEPVLRCPQLAAGSEMVAMFPNPKLVAYFVDPDTEAFSPIAESGEFASASLFAPKKLHHNHHLSDHTGWPKFH